MNTQRNMISVVTLMVTFSGFCMATLGGAAEIPRNEYIIYDDATTWKVTARKSSGAHPNVACTEEVFKGKTSVKINGIGAVFTPPEPISTTGYDRLEFRVHGGDINSIGRRIAVDINGRVNWILAYRQPLCIVPAGTWTLFSAPLVKYGNPVSITEISFGYDQGKCFPTPYYIDEIKLVSGPATPDDSYKRAVAPHVRMDPGFEEIAFAQYTSGCRVERVTSPVFEGKYAAHVYDKKESWGALSSNTTWEYERMGTGFYLYEGWYTAADPEQLKNGVSPAIEPISVDPAEPIIKVRKPDIVAMGVAMADKLFPAPQEKVKVIKDSTGKEWTWKYFRVVAGVNFGHRPTIMKSPLSSKMSDFYVDNFTIRKVGELPDSVKEPSQLVDPKTYLVTPKKTETIKQVSQTYKITVLGKEGSAAGEFRYPRSVALDKSGKLYVADTDNHRLQVWDNNTWTPLGSAGTKPGEFNYPRTIVFDRDGLACVNDTGNARVQRRNASGQWSVLTTVLADGDPKAVSGKKTEAKKEDGTDLMAAAPRNVSSIAFDAQNELLALETHEHWIKRLNKTSAWSYVSATEPIRERMSSWGLTPGFADFPMGMCVAPSGEVYLADTFNHRIQKRDAAGKWTVVAGGYHELTMVTSHNEWIGGSQVGQLYKPHSVAVDKDGNIYVADTFNHRIQIWKTDGSCVAFGSQGTGPGEFHYPMGITVDSKGTIYVADTRNHRIQIFEKK